ncbi:PucR family transcriptional regulator [Nocardioides jiangxiensis]|uniref:Helix-turn-helix domain-containing protein n=1 Tax=Nocardioides jiangxiensis TaxID=3064524 RepID=A0ABT9AY36_9ACTN|nr:helix-turn-helix domain-containing protein [Nocardioides sp. WY-20]MDO7867233.1 helix-turn-helix domain-containing protein [Nocardioides sp. WY-20]
MPIDPALQRLMTWVEPRLPALAVAAQETIVARVPAYTLEEPVPASELRWSVEENLRFLITALGSPDGDDVDMRTPVATGQRRARAAMPLPEVLRAYRLVFSTLWEALVGHVRASDDPELAAALFAAASRLWQLADEHAVALTEAYRATTAEMLVRDQRRRSALVEALFLGTAGSGSCWEAASLLGLPPDSGFVAVAAETTGLAEESLPDVERRLLERGLASAWRLMPALQVGIVALPEGREADLIALLGEITRSRSGVSPRYTSIAETPRALQLARAAISVQRAGKPGVHLFSSSPLAALMACDPAAAERLGVDVLGAVLALPSEDRDVLLETLHAYLDQQASAELAGRVLHCHPNTVRYRLRRLTEIAGRSLQDPYALAELAAASYAVRMRNERGRLPGGA